MQGVDFGYSNGRESMSIAAMQAATKLVEDLRDCTPLVEQDPHELRERGQSGVGEWV